MRDDDDFEEDRGFPEGDDSTESNIWQLLSLINPGDEESALQQFAEYREAAADGDESEPIELVARVIDWRSGFMVDAADLRSLMQALDELSARWNLSIDWGGDPDDEGYFDDVDADSLFGLAYDRLAESGYTLWSRETDDDLLAGWMTLTRDNESMGEVAAALHVNLRLGRDLG